MQKEDYEEQIRDINIQEGSTYGFIGGCIFILVATIMGLKDPTDIINALFGGTAAMIGSVAISKLTIGKIFDLKRKKASQNFDCVVTANEDEKTLTQEKTKDFGQSKMYIEDYIRSYPIVGDFTELCQFYGVQDDSNETQKLAAILNNLNQQKDDNSPEAIAERMALYEILHNIYSSNKTMTLKRTLKNN